MSKRKFQSGNFINILGEGWEDKIISLEEWKRRKIIWQEENTRPLCYHHLCYKKLPAFFGKVLVQRYEPTDYPKESWGYADEDEGKIMHDTGVRQKTDYSSFLGFGYNYKGIFCNSRCCERFAYVTINNSHHSGLFKKEVR